MVSGPLISAGRPAPPPSRAEALEELRALAAGLPVAQAGVERLLERIAGTAEAELLRALLVEAGALALLRGGGR